jgi:hypothetical protein
MDMSSSSGKLRIVKNRTKQSYNLGRLRKECENILLFYCFFEIKNIYNRSIDAIVLAAVFQHA